MKSHSVVVDTRKTVQQIIQILNSFNCSIQRINPDPFGTDQADIEVVMVGKATFADTVKNVGAGKSEWGVQVYVYDMGKYRHCELVALGESGWTSGLGRSMTDVMINGLDYINMRHSKTYRDKIIRKLEPVDTAAEKRKSDAGRSRLYKALRALPDIDDDELFRRQCTAMAPLTERFLKNHPEFSAAEVLAGECAGMYNIAGNSAKSEEIIRTMKIDENQYNLNVMNGASAELLQIAEDDALAGNDRSALYVLAFYMSMFESQGDKASFFTDHLLDRVLRLENSGKDVSEDLKIWPLLAKAMSFDDWHMSKYGENGTSGKLEASDPAVNARAAVPSAEPETAPPPAQAAPPSAQAAPAIAASAGKTPEKHAKSDGDTVSISKKTLLIAGGILTAILLAVLLISVFSKPKGEAAPAAEEEVYEESGESRESAEEVQNNEADYSDENTAESGGYSGIALEPEDRVYAHRGTGGSNDSFASYDAAIEQGAKNIEQDVVLSESGELYVSNKKKSDAELKADGNIRLRDVFTEYGKSVNYIVEIKTRDAETVEAFEDLVDEMGMEDNVQVQCFETWVLDEISSVLPSAPEIYLVDDAHGGQEALDKALDLDYIDIISVSVEDGLMTDANCEKVHSAGKMFSAWVLDDDTSVVKAINMSVDTYFTRYPGKAIQLEIDNR